MDKETSTLALVLVTILAVFVAVQPLIPSNAEQFSELGILGPTKTLGGYPTNLTAGQVFMLYGYVGNHEGVVSYYKVFVKLGNQNTVVSNSTYANVPILSTHSLVLDNNQSSTFPIGLSVGQTGTNLKLIFELWRLDTTTSQFGYTGLGNYLLINVTSK
jgi:uncharacterized membrane protein